MRAGFHYDIMVARRDGVRSLVARKRVGSLTAEKAVPMPETMGAVELSVECNPDWFDLGYIDAEGKHVSLMRGEARFLSTEIAGGFTGLFIALYAYAGSPDGPASQSWARCHRFTYDA